MSDTSLVARGNLTQIGPTPIIGNLTEPRTKHFHGRDQAHLESTHYSLCFRVYISMWMLRVESIHLHFDGAA